MEGEAARRGGQFRYLGYIIKRNGDQKENVRDRVKKAAAIMGQVWGKGREGLEEIGEGRCDYSTSWCGRYWGTVWRYWDGKKGRRWKNWKRSEMSIRCGWEDTKLYSKGKVTKRS